MEELWRTIAQFPDYEVSNLGRVRSLKWRKERILKPWKHSFGYDFVSLYVPGEKVPYKRLIHALVCEAFHGPKPTPMHEVAHWNGDQTNNRWDNLRWALPIENHRDKVRHGTHSVRTQFQQQLTDDEVREIRRLLAEGWTQSRIANKFGIWQTHVSHIKLGRRLSHVK
jgi:hypothetical protein